MNTFGNFPTFDAAAAYLLKSGFTFKADELGERFVKPSQNAFGTPMTAIAKVIECTVDPKYNQPNYFQYGFL